MKRVKEVCRILIVVTNVLVVWDALTVESHAAMLTVPAGLTAGQQYRIAFVTSTTRNALSTNINDYNTFVNNAANAGSSLLQPLGATWKAIGSTFTPSVSAATNIGGSSSLPIYLLDGTLLANNTTDLFDGSIAHALNLNELGNVTSATRVWTGTFSTGAVDTFAPLGAGGQIVGEATQGLPTSTGVFWLQNNHVSVNGSFPLYGISSPITALPEPSALILGGFGAIGLAAFARRRAKAKAQTR